MSESTGTLPAPEVVALPPSKWEREYQAFRRLLPALLQTHRGQYVAIHNEQVLDSDASEPALLARVLETIGNVSVHVDLVTDAVHAPLRVPHYRAAGSTGEGP